MLKKSTILLALCIPALIAAGCSITARTKARVPVRAARPAAPRSIDTAKVKPNELGGVLILEYHDVGSKERRWERRFDNFRADLQKLYMLGYQPISLRDYVLNNINTTAGKSPVIFTFDDATAGQFTYLNEGGKLKVDPNCAVGIMEDFARKHPDWPLKATFYVYYPVPFRQKQYVAQKLRHIVEVGMDIGNHTYTHANLSRESDAGAIKEIALNVKATLGYAPKAIVDSIALPYGYAPKNRAVLISGEYQGTRYHNIAALLVGAEPAPSPVARNFNPYKLPRVQGIQSELDKWLGNLKKHPERRYISDGDPNTITVPKALAADVDRSKLGKGKVLRTYY